MPSKKPIRRAQYLVKIRMQTHLNIEYFHVRVMFVVCGSYIFCAWSSRGCAGFQFVEICPVILWSTVGANSCFIQVQTYSPGVVAAEPMNTTGKMLPIVTYDGCFPRAILRLRLDFLTLKTSALSSFR